MEGEDLQLLNPQDVARILKVAKVTVYAWAHRGLIPFFKLEGTIRFTLTDVRKFVESRRIETKK